MQAIQYPIDLIMHPNAKIKKVEVLTPDLTSVVKRIIRTAKNDIKTDTDKGIGTPFVFDSVHFFPNERHTNAKALADLLNDHFEGLGAIVGDNGAYVDFHPQTSTQFGECLQLVGAEDIKLLLPAFERKFKLWGNSSEKFTR